jgi:hypothetical protein
VESGAHRVPVLDWQDVGLNDDDRNDQCQNQCGEALQQIVIAECPRHGGKNLHRRDDKSTRYAREGHLHTEFEAFPLQPDAKFPERTDHRRNSPDVSGRLAGGRFLPVL